MRSSLRNNCSTSVTSVAGRVVTPLLLAGVVVLLAVIFIWPAATLMGALPLNVNRQMIADNFLTSVLAVLALWARGKAYKLREEWEAWDLNTHGWGEVFIILGLLVHRPFWTPPRLVREVGSGSELDTQVHWMSFAATWENAYAAIATVGQAFWWLGLILLTFPLLRRWMPETWPVAIASLAASSWIVGYQLPDLYALAFGS